MSRPKTVPDGDYYNLCLRLRKGVYEFFKAEAEKRSIALASLIRLAVLDYVRRNPVADYTTANTQTEE